MEVLGAIASAMTLATLFNATVEAFDLIQLYQGHDADLKRLQIQLKMEKCRLYIWGEVMGLTAAEGSSSNLLDHWQYSDVAAECLARIHDLFHDADALEVKYGCFLDTANKPPDKAQKQLEQCSDTHIAAAFSDFKMKSRRTLNMGLRAKFRKSKWIIQDRKRFTILINDVQNLITGLHNITGELSSSSRLDRQFEKRISRITNLETLNSITCACQESHPYIASAASALADSISSGSQPILDFAAWQAKVEDSLPEVLSMASLEDLTVTELKHAIIDLKRNQAEKDALFSKLEGSMYLLSDEMVKITTKTERETKSMHIVTLLTLIFLPVTFLAVSKNLTFTDRKMTLTLVQTFFSIEGVAFASLDAQGIQGTWLTAGGLSLATVSIWYISWSQRWQSRRERIWNIRTSSCRRTLIETKDWEERNNSMV